MSGHSKWASIKHKKGAADVKRGKVFTKLIREITVTAREGGGDPNANPYLRLAIQRAKAANMPAENIERGIKKGTGELEGVSYEQITYEGYGPGGVAILVEALSDNRNRTTSDIRNIFSKRGGNMAGQGAVSWIFEKKGYIVINKTDVAEDKLMSVALEAGAEDMKTEETTYAVITQPIDFEKVKQAIEAEGVKIDTSEISNIPKNTVKLTGGDVKKILELVNELEDHDDVQNVSANFDIPDDVLDREMRNAD
jgi:YebC/PmpR family DNA-binding regulatory protein